MRAWLDIDGDHDQVRVRTNVAGLDSCMHGPLVRALGVHLGYDVELRKAVQGDPDVDPRYPWLRTLILAARRDWDQFGAQLTQEVRNLLMSGKLLPLTNENEAILRELFADHAMGFTVVFAGHDPEPQRVQRLINKGLVDPDHAGQSHIEISYKLGRGLDALAAHLAPADQQPDLEQLVADASRVPLTAQDRHAIDYARRRAAIYMRRPLSQAQTEADRILTERERARVGDVIAGGGAARHRADQVARDLQEALRHTTLTNDLDRVARTELHFAHSHGAYVGLKTQAAAAGMDAPLVYKIVRGGACRHCRRIWGPPTQPRTYLLSFVESRDAAGGNFRLPASQWGPVIGPVHPNCTEGALLLYTPQLHEAVLDAADWLDDIFGS